MYCLRLGTFETEYFDRSLLSVDKWILEITPEFPRNNRIFVKFTHTENDKIISQEEFHARIINCNYKHSTLTAVTDDNRIFYFTRDKKKYTIKKGLREILFFNIDNGDYDFETAKKLLKYYEKTLSFFRQKDIKFNLQKVDKPEYLQTKFETNIVDGFQVGFLLDAVEPHIIRSILRTPTNSKKIPVFEICFDIRLAKVFVATSKDYNDTDKLVGLLEV